MKIKEAIEKYHGSFDLPSNMHDLFYNECLSRIALRSHGGKIKVTRILVDGVIKEVSEWFAKVADGVKFDKEKLAGIVDYQEQAVYAKFHITDAKADIQLKAMRAAYQSGIPPILALTPDGLDAVSKMMLGQIASEIRESLSLEGKGELTDNS